jgi:DNA-binding NarL/FixJ family response regulator
VTVIHSVLVVDDYAPWRRYVRTEVQKNPRWRVIGEASDGVGAVRQAQTHKPDLILLDVGLPTLNGLEAARRILAHDPSSRILFLTENRSRHVAEAALRIGARGYVLKMDVSAELLSAMETVVNGGRFLSAGIARQIVETEPEPIARERYHEAGFYSDEASLLDGYARFAEAALVAGNAIIVVSAERRQHQLHERLQARGVAIDRAIREGRYLTLDPNALLSQFMVDGWPDEARFRTAGAALVAAGATASTKEQRRVAACGESVATLWREGHAEAAVRLEQLWDELARTGDVDIFCGYELDVPHLQDDAYALFQRICAEHSDIHVL